jgi:hypothetical protein
MRKMPLVDACIIASGLIRGKKKKAGGISKFPGNQLKMPETQKSKHGI